MKRSYFSNTNFLVALALASLIGGAAGCSVATPAALIEARNTYQQAQKSPDITGNAAMALRDAEQTLNRGERDWEQNRDQGEAEHLAYVTKQRVEIAKRIAERNMAEKDIERLGDERQKVIIEAREREVSRSRKEAEAQAQAAERAEREAAAAQAQTKKAQAEALARTRETELARKTAAQTRVEAEAARRFLTENGLAQDRITARGLGEAFPVGSNDTGPGRQMNRRVEIVIANEKQAGHSAK